MARGEPAAETVIVVRRCQGRGVVAAVLLVSAMLAGGEAGAAAPSALPLSRCKGADAKLYRDDRTASADALVAVMKEDGRTYGLFRHDTPLPPGDYVVTARLEAQPLPVQHGLEVTITSGGATRTVRQVDFDGTPGPIPGAKTPVVGGGYQPFAVRVVHPGGPLAIRITAVTAERTDGVKRTATDEEKAARAAIVPDDTLGLDGPAGTGPELQLEEDPAIASLTHEDRRVAVGGVEIVAVRQPPAVVAAVEVEKVHYRPGETVRAVARLCGGPAGGAFTLVADDVTEIDDARRVHAGEVQVAAGRKVDVPFEFTLGQEQEFGHEVRCMLLDGEREVHAGRGYFGCSANVYRIAITGNDVVGQDKSKAERTALRAGMERNKANYANHFEQFSWAPCTFSDMTPETEEWYSGQTQYHGTKTGYRMMIDEAHRVGIKVLSYGHAGGGGIAALENSLRHPEIFATGNEGFGLYNTFLAERAYHGEYVFPDVTGTRRWIFWLPVWSGSGLEAAEWSAREISGSIEMFGWDGVRWDQPVDHEQLIRERVLAAHPRCVWGYNTCFARPKEETFLPPKQDTAAFHRLAADHGMMMDESVRKYHGDIRPYYAALASEADYIKRIGGLPLIITFDQGSRQDGILDCRLALAAGERYTYNTSCGDYEFGIGTKFLTRFSAFVWDDTARIADAGRLVEVKVGRGPTAPWYDRTVWLRKLADGRQQLLVNLVNPPGYTTFGVRIQPPPATLRDVAVAVPTPAGARLVRAVHLSPDLPEGQEPLETAAAGDRAAVTLPRLRSWSLVVFEYAAAAGGGTLSYPAFPLTTPLEDAQAEFARLDADKAAREEAAARERAARVEAGLAQPKPATEGTPPYLDFTRTIDVDEEAARKLERPSGTLAVHRDGRLDVLHVNGIFAWLNPVENALGLAGGGTYAPAWISSHSWAAEADGATYGFPETLDALLERDVVVLSNVHARALGPRRRAMLAAYVRAGGGLVVFTDRDMLSMGADHNTALADLLPVTIRGRLDLARNDAGMPLRPAAADFFPADVRWDRAPQAYCLDRSPLKPDVEVLATAGDFPAIVSRRVGAGRVITLLVNHVGDHAADSLPYWTWIDWPRVVATCLVAAAGDYRTVDPPRLRDRPLDPGAANPEALEVEGATMDSREFTLGLRSAKKNMVNARMARALMTAAIDHAENVEDIGLFSEIADAAGPYLDASFAPLAKKLVASPHAPLRKLGYRVVGFTGDAECRSLLVTALEASPDVDTQRAILVALGRIRASEAIPAVRKYLAKGPEKLLAWAALKRMGDERAAAESMPLYAASTRTLLALQSDFWGQHETNSRLGSAFTPARAKAARATMAATVSALENLAFDLEYYVGGLDPVTEAEQTAIGDFLRQTEIRTVAPLACTLLGRLPPGRAAALRRSLADAKLPQLRALAE